VEARRAVARAAAAEAARRYSLARTVGEAARRITDVAAAAATESKRAIEHYVSSATRPDLALAAVTALEQFQYCGAEAATATTAFVEATHCLREATEVYDAAVLSNRGEEGRAAAGSSYSTAAGGAGCGAGASTLQQQVAVGGRAGRLWASM
jgi:hypothetical protein